MTPLRFLHLIFLALVSHVGFSQIVDDSTKEIYGDHSTKYYLQEDIFQGFNNKRNLDTSLNYLHYYNYQYTNGTWYQGLGNMGMAMKPMYYKSPEDIGYRLGFEAFHPYLNSTAQQRYFDTKSPYTELYYLQGGTGEQRFNILFSRNVNRYWNIGGSYNRFSSSKQLAVIQNRDFQTDHQQVNAFTSVKTKKDKYVALANFNYMQHWSYESGGVKMQPDSALVDSGMFLYKYSYVNLFKSNGAVSSQSANSLAARNYYKTLSAHLYHQYNPLDSGITLIKIFHELDWKRENQYFRDNNMKIDTSNTKFYKETNFNDSMAFYQFKYELIQNKLGIKGNSRHLYYALHYKMRSYSLSVENQDSIASGKNTTRFQDAFAGVDIGYRLTEDLTINASGQTMVSFSTNSLPDRTFYTKQNDYQLNLNATFKDWSLNVSQNKVSPSLMQTRMVTNLALWTYPKDSLNAVVNRNASVRYLHVKGNRFLKVGLDYQSVDNLIYFTRTIGTDSVLKLRPTQNRANVAYIQPQIAFRTNWRWIYFENDLILTKFLTDNEIIHMPSWYTMPKLYYQNSLFKKATVVQAGAELFLKADYYADFYAPQINQFYWQDTFKVPTFPITNVFINLKIKQVRLFLKVSNLFGDMNYQMGYLDTPYYPGMRRSFQFGLLWKAFD